MKSFQLVQITGNTFNLRLESQGFSRSTAAGKGRWHQSGENAKVPQKHFRKSRCALRISTESPRLPCLSTCPARNCCFKWCESKRLRVCFPSTAKTKAACLKKSAASLLRFRVNAVAHFCFHHPPQDADSGRQASRLQRVLGRWRTGHRTHSASEAVRCRAQRHGGHAVQPLPLPRGHQGHGNRLAFPLTSH